MLNILRTVIFGNKFSIGLHAHFSIRMYRFQIHQCTFFKLNLHRVAHLCNGSGHLWRSDVFQIIYMYIYMKRKKNKNAFFKDQCRVVLCINYYWNQTYGHFKLFRLFYVKNYLRPGFDFLILKELFNPYSNKTFNVIFFKSLCVLFYIGNQYQLVEKASKMRMTLATTVE